MIVAILLKMPKKLQLLRKNAEIARVFGEDAKKVTIFWTAVFTEIKKKISAFLASWSGGGTV